MWTFIRNEIFCQQQRVNFSAVNAVGMRPRRMRLILHNWVIIIKKNEPTLCEYMMDGARLCPANWHLEGEWEEERENICDIWDDLKVNKYYGNKGEQIEWREFVSFGPYHHSSRTT